MPSLFDSHCHFDFDAFKERDKLWQQCQEQGIQQLLIPGVCPEQWSAQAELCELYPGIVAASGLHPWWLENYSGDSNQLRKQLDNNLDSPYCVAIGECGLDKLIDCPLEKQLDFFIAHLDTAKQRKLPVIIHSRHCHSDVLQQLKIKQLPAGGVIHGFSGSTEQALQFWQLGFYLGIGGTITYERATKTRRAVSALPLEALLLETDAPDMPLSGHQGEANSPLYLNTVAQTLADLRDEPLAQVIKQTTVNSRTLFQLN